MNPSSMKTFLKKYEGPLASDKIAEAMDACLENADDLLWEAKLLLKHGHVARAFALTILSFEEMGKIAMLTTAAFFGRQKQLWKRFWGRFRSHTTKRRVVSGVEYVLLPKPTIKQTLREWEFEPYAERFKQLSLYVDCVGGAVVSPSRYFKSKEGLRATRAGLKFAQNRLSLFKKVDAKVPPI